MSMSTPFDPQQPGADLQVDGSVPDEVEVEQDRGADAGPADPAAPPASHEDEDEAGGGPVAR